MGKRQAFVKEWAETIGNLIEAGADLKAMCTSCGYWNSSVDKARIALEFGWDFSLVDRHPKCRTPGCAGRITFRAAIPGANAWPVTLKTPPDYGD